MALYLPTGCDKTLRLYAAFFIQDNQSQTKIGIEKTTRETRTTLFTNRHLHQRIWHLAWPMMLANISTPLLGIVDTAILGHLDSARYLAAVAVGSSLMSFLYWGFAFLRMGTTGLSAQAFGAGDQLQSQLLMGRSILLGITLGVLLILLSPWLLRLGFSLLVPAAGSEQLAMSYAQIRIHSAPALLVSMAVIGWLIGQQQTRWPLIITVFTHGLNIALDFLLIIGLGLHSDGAAIATVIAEYSGCALALAVVYCQWRGAKSDFDWRPLLRWADYRQLLLINRQLFIRTLALLFSFSFFTAQSAQLGENTLAANTLLINLLLLTAYGLDGFANAAEALVGEAIGQRNYDAFWQTCSHCALWSLATAGLFCGLFILFGPQLIALQTSLPAVFDLALVYLPWLWLLPLITVWSYLLDGIFIGATRTGPMQHTMLFSLLVVYLPAWYFTQALGNEGLWLALLVFNLARSLSLGLVFWSVNYRHNWW